MPQHLVNSSQQEKTLYILCLTDFTLSFALFGMLSTLILFFVKNLGYSESLAYSVLGNFTALAYLSALVAGFLGGRYLSFKSASIVGTILMLIGYLFLALYQHFATINIGLALIACGNGFVAPNLRNLLGANYNTSSFYLRDKGYITLHVFNISGQILGPLLLTYLKIINASLMFVTAAMVLLLGLFNFAIRYKSTSPAYYSDRNRAIHSAEIFKGLVITVLLLGMVMIIMEKRDVKYLLEAVFITVFTVFPVLLTFIKRTIRIKIISCFIPLGGLLVAEICFRLTMGVVNLFTEQYVNRQLIATTLIPTGMLQAVEPIFIFIGFYPILLLRKYLERQKIYITTGSSIAGGLLGLSLSFACLVLGIILAPATKIALHWLLICYAIMAVSELFILPIATAAIAALAPINWRSILMGFLFLITSLASYLASWIGQWLSPAFNEPTLLNYKNLFIDMALFAAVGALIIFTAWKSWLRLYRQEMLLDE